MKSLREIKGKAEKGDYTRVAEIVNMSPDLVKRVITGERTDHHGIQKAFSDLLESRERITHREKNRRIRKAQRMAA
jgi:hypothetical protein